MIDDEWFISLEKANKALAAMSYTLETYSDIPKYSFVPKYPEFLFTLRKLKRSELISKLSTTNDDDILSEVIARALDDGWSCFFYAKHKTDFPHVRWYVFDCTLELELPDETPLASFTLDEILADEYFMRTFFGWDYSKWYKRQLEQTDNRIHLLGSHL